MKIRQTVRHIAARRALELPLVGDRVHNKLVDLHTRIFLDRAPDDQREARRPRVEAFFDGSMKAYLTALQEEYTEAEAREITHIQANLDFYAHGWTEMMEIPPDELPVHLERYHTFFEDHSITPSNPLGEFAPEEGLPTAPATPKKRDDGETPFAESGYADDVYVQSEDDLQQGPTDGPQDATLADAPGVSDDS